MITLTFLNAKCVAEKSFFMTEQESSKILHSLSNKKSVVKNVSGNRIFNVSGILYMCEDNWTVWIDGVAYSTIGQQNGFSIDAVTENMVSLTLNDGTLLNLSITTGDKNSDKSDGDDDD
jgi:hypothetical protein